MGKMGLGELRLGEMGRHHVVNMFWSFLPRSSTTVTPQGGDEP